MKFIFLVMFFVFQLYALVLEPSTQQIDLLQNASIYKDTTRKETIQTVTSKDFVKNKQSLIGYGYSPNFDIWVRFTLTNSSDKSLTKIIEYANPLTTHLEFYEDTILLNKEGLFNIAPHRVSINPIFHVTLQPFETKTYYIKASSNITTLILKLNLWSNDAFYDKEIRNQFYLALFFGAMTILGLYNLFVFFFTRDKNYLYYVLYITGIVFHHLMYVGVAYIYLLDIHKIQILISYSSLIVGLPAFALALFTQSYVQASLYPRLNKILTFYLYLFPFMLSIFIFTDTLNKYRNIFSVILLLYLVFLTIYATYKNNRQAYFILFGWLIFITSGMFMYLSSIGVFNIYEIFPYYVEIALVLEAIIFSIALTDKIKQLQIQKEFADKQLILNQQNEQKRLQITVNEKTKDLQKALDEKELLLKELNHRVKNNMQTIISLIRLQSDEIEDENIQDIFRTIQNRINAMSHLHELLYKQDNITTINTTEYFKLLINELQESYDKNIDIVYDISTNLKIDIAVYCGLILNELVSNTFKHAFDSCQNAIVEIILEKNKNETILVVKDNGKGYIQNNNSNSLGLILVHTLAVDQLHGQLLIDSINGTIVRISWSDDE